MIVRWDNTPHYPELEGFPCHKHEGKQVVGSKNMIIEEVLEELMKTDRCLIGKGYFYLISISLF